MVTLQLKSDLREEFTKSVITLENPYDFKKQIEEAIIEIPSGPIDNNLGTQSCSPAQNPPAPIFDNPKPIHSGDNQIIQSGKFVCETCGKAFQTFPNLKQHKFTHIDEKKFNCSMCPKTFKRLSGLNQVCFKSVLYLINMIGESLNWPYLFCPYDKNLSSWA